MRAPRTVRSAPLLSGVLVALAVLWGSAPAHADPHGICTDDFEQAKATARKEGKDLLIVFTGSDWCTPCNRLAERVFGAPEYQEVATNYFVHVKVDFPRDATLVTDAVRRQNATLKDRYKPKGFPTVLLADADGRVYARTGFRSGGPRIYLKHLAELRKLRDAEGTAVEKCERVVE